MGKNNFFFTFQQGDNDPVDVVEIGEAECAMGSVTPVKPLGVLAMIDDGELDWKVSFFLPFFFFVFITFFFLRALTSTENLNSQKKKIRSSASARPTRAPPRSTTSRTSSGKRERKVFSPFIFLSSLLLSLFTFLTPRLVSQPPPQQNTQISLSLSVFPGELERIRVWFRNYKIPDGKPENKFGYNNKVQPKAFALEVIEETNGFWRDLTSGKRENDEGMAF